MKKSNVISQTVSERLLLYLLLPALFLLIITSCEPAESEKIRLIKQKRKTALVAHRGASGAAPENTLAAIKKALQSPAEYIEVDIHLTKDTQLVVMHDATVNRTTNGKGAIADLTLAELKKLDAGGWFDSTFTHERIPTLREVLHLVNKRKKLLIQIKKGDDYYKGIEDLVMLLIRENNAQDWCILQSFHDPVLERIWKNEFTVPTHKLIIGKMPWIPLYYDDGFRWGSLEKYYRASAINVHHYFATREFIKHVHNFGFKTFVWTVDDPQEINELVDRGADGVMTNAITTLEIDQR